MKIRQNKLMGYLAVTTGVGCASSVANAAVVFYGNASNNNLMADPAGISFVPASGYGGFTYQTLRGDTGPVYWGRSYAGNVVFSRGSDVAADVGANYFIYHERSTAYGRSPLAGMEVGASNYANMTFDGNDMVYEAVAQFFLTGNGTGYLMAIATTNAIPNRQNLSAVGGPALSISAGKAMIDGAMGVNDFAAAVPEPSSLVLLALGATGLAARRQRKKAA